MGWLIILGVIAVIVYYTAQLFYYVIVVPIQSAANALREAEYKEQRRRSLNSIHPEKGRVKVNLNSYGRVEVEGYDPNSNLISVIVDKDPLLKNSFPRELEHAEWRRNFISKLNDTDLNQWKKVLDTSWMAIRVLEERDRVVGTLLSEEQTKAITQFADQALVSIYYKSTHANNQALYNQIIQELNQAEEDYKQAEDGIQKRSISTAIKTHQMRLERQKSVEKNLHLVDSELDSLKATLNLVIEGIRSEISSYHLRGGNKILSYDSALLELELPILDEIWQSTL